MSSLIYLGLLLFIVSVYSVNENVFCYYGTWATYRHGSGKFGVENIDPYLCTHIVYSFLGISDDGSLKILDEYLDLEENWGRGNIKKFMNLKETNPKLKLMFAVGGWNEGSLGFSNVARDSLKRQKFASQVLQFCLDYGFDGFDVDWEYPGQRGGEVLLDKDNFVLLLKDLHNKLSPKGILLTVAVAAAESSSSISYDIPSISRYVDFILLMAYDLHGPWDDNVGLNAPLYESDLDQTAIERQLNVNASVHYWLRSGAPKNKLILGMPLYGRTFSLRDSTKTAVGASHNGPGIAGVYTNEPGFMGYNEICEKKLSEHWSRIWEPQQQAPYLIFNKNWISYDDSESLTLKAQFVKDLGLAGAMLWSIETDDFIGNCGKGKFPLLNVVSSIIRSGVTEETTTTISPTTTSTSEPTEFICPSDGLFRDPKDCSRFYLCAGANKYDFFCPNGLLFDINSSTCNWPNLVDC
ncbi:hypothetical protein HA402_011811 [Bradysia odoriphaga]|uniref:chitinase n=1 Tax=Bradysia odoriphaga TaxID=1564500 RepID=A0A385GLM9_9DIPT|nr:chitinase [Bradysia odoriphaga]KAG4071657.1 hypothetical protein HA402_011811 [Bradysia odoriphaga]